MGTSDTSYFRGRLFRTFEPVGHGAFYHEDLEYSLDEEGKAVTRAPIIVYDCGSRSNASEERVQVAFPKKAVIPAAYISHLHEDHVSGLERLLKHCDVKTLFLPFFGKEAGVALQLLHLAEGGETQGFSYELCGSPVHTLAMMLGRLKKKITLYFVKAAGDKEEDVWQNEDPVTVKFVNSGEDTSSLIDAPITGKSLVGESLLLCWSFIPFNLRYDKRLGEIVDKLREQGIEVDAQKEFAAMDLWKDPSKREAIKKAFEQKNENLDSMTLYSGRRNHCCKLPFYLTGEEAVTRTVPPGIEPGCLYTGDYMTMAAKKPKKEETNRWEPLWNQYANYRNYIGMVQIPHHGAGKYFNPKLVEDFDAKYYVVALGDNEVNDSSRKKVNKYFRESVQDGAKRLVKVTNQSPAAVFHSTVMDWKWLTVCNGV